MRETGRQELAGFLQLQEKDMEASPHRQSTTPRATSKKTLSSFGYRLGRMRSFVSNVNLLAAHLGHVFNGGRMTLGCTGTFRAEAEFSMTKTRKSTNRHTGKRVRRQGADSKATLAQFFRVLEMLHSQREARNSVEADKVSRRPPMDVYADATRELEHALTQHGHTMIRRELDLLKNYVVVVAARDVDGHPTAFNVSHRRATRPAHRLFRSLRPAVRRVKVSTDEDGNVRLSCSCPFPTMMGMPCRHICAVNGGASHGDVVVRYHMAALQGQLDAVVCAADAPSRYPGAVMTDYARAWFADLPTFEHANLANLQTFELANIRTCEPSNLQTCWPANLRTCEQSDRSRLHTCEPAKPRRRPASAVRPYLACPLTYFLGTFFAFASFDSVRASAGMGGCGRRWMVGQDNGRRRGVCGGTGSGLAWQRPGREGKGRGRLHRGG